MKWPGSKARFTFKVRSKSQGNKYHIVELWGDDWYCDCLYNYFKKKECEHISKCKKEMEKRLPENRIIQIREPFYTAGKMFRWPYKDIGVGINMLYMTGINNELRIKIGDNPKVWTIRKDVAKSFVERWNTYYNAKGTKLGVIPWEMLKEENIPQASLL